MAKRYVVIPKVWRSELGMLFAFVVLSVGSVMLSERFPASILEGQLLEFGSARLVLHLPLFWLLPAMALGFAIQRIYNVRYTMDSNGIQTKVGIISLKQTITRIRFEDVRSVETHQSLLERLLDIGGIGVGTAAEAGIEVEMLGIAAPYAVQQLVQTEREKRLKLARRADFLKSEERREATGG